MTKIPSLTPQAFDGYVQRLLKSRNALLKRSIFFGLPSPHGYPVLLDKNTMVEHTHVLGAPGSGKTSRSLIPTTIQLIRGDDGPVVILDMKGDMALFHTARIEAEKTGRTFKWFTNMADRSTYVFNPWDRETLSRMTVPEIVGLETQKLNLYHGDDYGPGWFSTNSRILLKRAIEQTFHHAKTQGQFAAEAPIESYEDLHRILRKLAVDDKEFHAAQHLAFLIEELAGYPQLNLAPRHAKDSPAVRHAIHMPEVLREHQVIYFCLPGAFDASATGQIARLALYMLITAARGYKDQHGCIPRAYLVVDEAQVLVAKNIENVLAQSRSFGIACILAHQSMSQLNPHGGADLRELFLDCTSVKQFFTARDPWLMRMIAESSGQAKYRKIGYETGYDPVAQDDVQLWRARFHDGSIRVHVTEEYGPRLTNADILDCTYDPGMCMTSIGGDSKISPYHGWFPMRTFWPISYREYKRRQTELPWPEPNEETITVESQWPTRPDSPPGEIADPSVAAGEQLRSILKGLRAPEP